MQISEEWISFLSINIKNENLSRHQESGFVPRILTPLRLNSFSFELYIVNPTNRTNMDISCPISYRLILKQLIQINSPLLKIYTNITEDGQIETFEIFIHEVNFKQELTTKGFFKGQYHLIELIDMASDYIKFNNKFMYYFKLKDEDLEGYDENCAKLKHPLFHRQVRSLAWMEHIEEGIINSKNYLYTQAYWPIVNTGYMYDMENKTLIPKEDITEKKKVYINGGFYTDKTGSGKTAVILALLHRNKIDFTDRIPNNYKSVLSNPKTRNLLGIKLELTDDVSRKRKDLSAEIDTLISLLEAELKK